MMARIPLHLDGRQVLVEPAGVRIDRRRNIG